MEHIRKIKPGDIVRLKVGGVALTAVRYKRDPASPIPLVVVTWNVSGKRRIASICESDLEILHSGTEAKNAAFVINNSPVKSKADKLSIRFEEPKTGSKEILDISNETNRLKSMSEIAIGHYESAITRMYNILDRCDGVIAKALKDKPAL